MPGVQHPSGETEARFKSPPQVLGWARALQSVHFCPHCLVLVLGEGQTDLGGVRGAVPALSLDGVPTAGAPSADGEPPRPRGVTLASRTAGGIGAVSAASERPGVTRSSGTRGQLRAGPSTWASPLHGPAQSGAQQVAACEGGVLGTNPF